MTRVYKGGELREQIFALAAQDVPRRQIARQLGLSEGSVRYQLDRHPRANVASAGDGLGPASSPASLAGDPDLADERKRLERERLELLGLDVKAKRLEAQRRLELLQSGGNGGQGAGLLMVIEGLRDLRGEIARVAAQAGRPPSAPAAPSVTDRLQEMKQLSELVQSFAPPRAPTSALELEFKAMEIRLNAEERRIQRQLDREHQERMELARGQARRDEAVAMAIENTLPVLGTGINRWIDGQVAARTVGAPGQSAAQLGTGESQGEAQLREGEIAGNCPSCQAPLAVPVDNPGSCPRCQSPLVVIDGEIRTNGRIRKMRPVAS